MLNHISSTCILNFLSRSIHPHPANEARMRNAACCKISDMLDFWWEKNGDKNAHFSFCIALAQLLLLCCSAPLFSVDWLCSPNKSSRDSMTTTQAWLFCCRDQKSFYGSQLNSHSALLFVCLFCTLFFLSKHISCYKAYIYPNKQLYLF